VLLQLGKAALYLVLVFMVEVVGSVSQIIWGFNNGY